LIVKDAQCGLPMRIAATESNSLCERTEKLTALLELQATSLAHQGTPYAKIR
jgi:hypothetical protein